MNGTDALKTSQGSYKKVFQNIFDVMVSMAVNRSEKLDMLTDFVCAAHGNQVSKMINHSLQDAGKIVLPKQEINL